MCQESLLPHTFSNLLKIKENLKQIFETNSISMHLMLEKMPENDSDNVPLFM